MRKPRDKQLLRPKRSTRMNRRKLKLLAPLPLLQRRSPMQLSLQVCHHRQAPRPEPKTLPLLYHRKRKSNKWPKNSRRQLNSRHSNKGKISPLKTPWLQRRPKKNRNSSTSSTKRANSSKPSSRARKRSKSRIRNKQPQTCCTP